MKTLLILLLVAILFCLAPWWFTVLVLLYLICKL